MSVLSDIKKEMFVQNIMKGMSEKDAYLDVYPASKNYKDATVRHKASVLMGSGDVQARFAELRQQANAEAMLSFAERARVLSEIAMNTQERAASRIQAVDVLNKMDGAYVQKVEAHVTAPVSETASKIAEIMALDDGT